MKRIHPVSTAGLVSLSLLAFTGPTFANSATVPVTRPSLSQVELVRTLRRLAALPSPEKRSREWLTTLNQWSRAHGNQTTAELLWSQVTDSKLPETDRYLCLQAAADLEGRSIAPKLESLLDTSSSEKKSPTPWMLKSAAIQSLARLNARESGASVLHVLREEPALVVRLEAVRATALLKPEGAEQALLAAAEDPRNWNGDRPVWVPERALDAIEAIRGVKAPSSLQAAGASGTLRARIAWWKRRLTAASAQN